MREIENGLGRAVLYTLSGGFVSLAFGVLGATAAEAKPIPNNGGGGDPVSAMKTASLVPGMGVFKVAADATEKVAKNTGGSNSEGKGKQGNNESKRDSDGDHSGGDGKNSKKSDRGSGDSEGRSEKERQEPKRSADDSDRKSNEHESSGRDREEADKALRTMGLLPGMGAVKALNYADDVVTNAKRSHEMVQSAHRPQLAAVDKPSNGRESRATERDGERRSGAREAARFKPSGVPVVGGYAKLADDAKDAVARWRAAGAVPVAGTMVKLADVADALQARAVGPHRAGGQATNAELATARSAPSQWDDDDGPIIHYPFCPTRDCDRAMKYLFGKSPRQREEPAGGEGKILEPEGDLLGGAEGGYYLSKSRIVTSDGHEIGRITVGADGKAQATKTRDGGINLTADGFAGVRSTGAEIPSPEGPVTIAGNPVGDFGFTGHGELVLTPTEGVKAGASLGAEVKAQSPEFGADLWPIRIKIQPEARFGAGVEAEGSIAPDEDGRWHLKGKSGLSLGPGAGLGFDISLAD